MRQVPEEREAETDQLMMNLFTKSFSECDFLVLTKTVFMLEGPDGHHTGDGKMTWTSWEKLIQFLWRYKYTSMMPPVCLKV